MTSWDENGLKNTRVETSTGCELELAGKTGAVHNRLFKESKAI